MSFIFHKGIIAAFEKSRLTYKVLEWIYILILPLNTVVNTFVFSYTLMEEHVKILFIKKK